MMIKLAESGYAPDSLVRFGIRRLLTQRLELEQGRTDSQAQQQQLRKSPVAVHQDQANEQHYEVDARFYQHVLGHYLKYSSGYWPDGVTTLDGAEQAMLALTCERAELANDQDILEMGCGWGSLSLWMAEHYPGSRITAISNSASQKDYIMEQARAQGLDNVQVVTADAAVYHPQQLFDRVVTVEMFEHMRNHTRLMARINEWLKPDGKLFVHVFCHRNLTYLFETDGEENWMGQYFFTGGMMPAYDWLPECAGALQEEQRWAINGNHYAKTLEAWLKLADQKREVLLPLLEEVYGVGQGKVWLQRWRMFFMACAELFSYRDGEEWFVAHYLFART